MLISHNEVSGGVRAIMATFLARPYQWHHVNGADCMTAGAAAAVNGAERWLGMLISCRVVDHDAGSQPSGNATLVQG